MNLVDSSGWLAFFADETNADHYAAALNDSRNLLVPTIIMYEVYKVMLREKGEKHALIAQANMQEGVVAELTPMLAISAAQLSLAHKIPMADSIILATAHHHDAVIWTQDEHFCGLKNVKWIRP